MYIKLSLIKKIKPIIFIILIIPAFYWFIKLYLGKMGVNPIDQTIRELGELSLRLLIITLFITSLSQIKGFESIKYIRRMIGLFVFFYICLHLISYVVLDHYFNWNFIFKDIYKRPFITLGFLSFLFTIPLAVTSNNISIRKLTYPVWNKIHMLIYLIAPLAGLHYFMLAKADKSGPILYLGLITLLLLWRIIYYLLKKFSLPK